MTPIRLTPKQVRALPSLGDMQCEACGSTVKRTSVVQRYCPPCSEVRDRKRKGLWAKAHPQVRSAEQRAAQYDRRQSATIERGAAVSAAAHTPFAWLGEWPDLLWHHRVSVPFDWSFSKNHIWTMTPTGHVFLRSEARRVRNELATLLARNFAPEGRQQVAQAKLWIDVFVQKPTHRGDAVNLLDVICDAVKDAVGLDDRWYSVRRLDWEIVKNDPRIYVGVGQDTDVDTQICSYCGRALPYGAFGKNKSRKNGISRECHDCTRSGARPPRS